MACDLVVDPTERGLEPQLALLELEGKGHPDVRAEDERVDLGVRARALPVGGVLGEGAGPIR